MRVIRLLLVAFACLATWPALASVMEFDGRLRNFEMFVPATAPRPLPVVLVLHGGRGTPEQMRRYSGFDKVAERENLIAVYPSAVAGYWNDGRPQLEAINAQSADAQDVDFLLALVDMLAEKGLADAKRVFVVGLANGGMMALRLACERPERIAGMAIVAASQPSDVECAPQRPVPAVFLHGTKDRFVPYEGGDLLPLANQDRGSVLSANKTVKNWRAIDGCDGKPTAETVVERRGHGRFWVERVTFGACTGAPVVHYVLHGGGHTWPGAIQSKVGDKILGSTGHDFDASEEIWSFFKDLPSR